MIKNFFKALLYLAAADILSLFVCFTLASSGMLFMRIICAFCTIGIMAGIIADLAVKTAENDLKAAKKEEKKHSPFPLAFITSMPSLISWAILKYSLVSGADFYRFYKLINGWCLQLFNIINSSSSTADLSEKEVLIMLPTTFLPSIVFIITYFKVFGGKKT